MTMLTFEADSHTYRWNKVVVPGVTSLLQQLHSFAGVPFEVLETARKRGSDVHSACEYFDQDDLDEATLTPLVRGYLEGWKLFLRDCEPNWSAIEEPVYHRLLRYAGTPDRFGDLTVKRKRVLDAQVDIKTSEASHPVWGLQTAAYNEAAGKPKSPRFTCQLKPDGKYRLLEWADPDDWPTFVSLTTLRTWKEKHAL